MGIEESASTGGTITITVYTGGLTLDFEGNEGPPIILEADQTVTLQVDGDLTFSGTGVVSIGTLTATVTHADGLIMVLPPVPSVYALERSHKQYELADHLGNVQATISDRKSPITGGANDIVAYYPVLLSRSEVYPFGWGLPWRQYNVGEYRYGFNGMEKDDEIKGSGNSYDFGARIYDPRVGRWLSVDPHHFNYPSLTPYAYVANNPVNMIDPDGRDIWIAGEDGSRTLYEQGMTYDGDDEFTSNAIASLNKMNTTEFGSKVLGELTSAESVYEFTNQKSASGTVGFEDNKEGLGGTFYMGNNIDLESVAHESFHGYQNLHGQGGASIHNEVEAYLFAEHITSLGQGGGGFSGSYSVSRIQGHASGSFNESMMELRFGENYSQSHFDNAVNLFKGHSGANESGLYSKYPQRRPNQTQSLIKPFYPLFR